MQNYRNNARPCPNYRHMLPPDTSSRQDLWNEKPLAMAYVPWQIWRDIYEAEKGFQCGTIFKELNLPFLGNGGSKR